MNERGFSKCRRVTRAWNSRGHARDYARPRAADVRGEFREHAKRAEPIDVARRRNGRGMPNISRLMSDSAEHLPISGSVPPRSVTARACFGALCRALSAALRYSSSSRSACSVLPGEASARIWLSRNFPSRL